MVIISEKKIVFKSRKTTWKKWCKFMQQKCSNAEITFMASNQLSERGQFRSGGSYTHSIVLILHTIQPIYCS